MISRRGFFGRVAGAIVAMFGARQAEGFSFTLKYHGMHDGWDVFQVQPWMVASHPVVEIGDVVVMPAEPIIYGSFERNH